MSEKTLKIPYILEDNTSSDLLKQYFKQYSNVFRYTYNRLNDANNQGNKLKTAEITKLQKEIKNCDLIQSGFKNFAQHDAKAVIKQMQELGQKKVIFGSRKKYFERLNNNISREEWEEYRLRPLLSVGEASKKGNRFFQILENDQVLFKPSKNNHFIFNLKVNKKRRRELTKLRKLAEAKLIALTFKLDKKYLYLSFENNSLYQINHNVKKDRVIALDLNPNYIGWSIIDWYDGGL